jgi:RNA polymerase sigma-70 factor (ECF subfamily)
MTQLQFQTDLLGHQERLLFYARSLTSDPDNAQDLLQETFLRALTYSEKFTQNTNFKAWIYTIMKNTFINSYHRNMNTKNTFDTTISDFHLSNVKDKGNTTPESIYNSKEIFKCINALDDEYKIPFNLFLEGFKYKEIADELNIPLGTIKSRIFLTRKKLERSLKEYRQ